MSFDPETTTPPGAKIKVIGVGGGGGNAVNTMIRSGLDGVDFITCNTDVQALRYSLATHKLQIGRELTRGLGAGADPDIGRDAALEDKAEIQKVLGDADMVFITAGMGGGTGTGGAAVVAQIARELGALTVAVVTKPFTFEGKRRRKQAESGIARLRESVDTLITIPNQRLLQVASPDLSMIDAFKMADEVLVNAVRGISDIINIHGVLNVDFADVKTVMSCMGQALMGIGSGRGEKRAVEAALMAISSPLLEEVDIEGATGILINITGGTRITMHEINEACGVIQEAAHEDANIIFGAVIDESLGDEIRVTVIATGFPVDKDEGDSDPIRGKPFPSVTATRLAQVAKQPTPERKSSLEEKTPPKVEIGESVIEPVEGPASPYDDLSFAPHPQKSALMTPAAPMIEPITTHIASTPVLDPAPSASSHSSLQEAQELAQWTLDLSAQNEPSPLWDEIPSLAAEPQDEILSTPQVSERLGLEVPLAYGKDHTDCETSLASPSKDEPKMDAATTIDATSDEKVAGASLIEDPEDDFIQVMNAAVKVTSLEDTLFESGLDQAPQEKRSPIHAQESLDSEVSLSPPSESMARQGATREEPQGQPLLVDLDELKLSEIDRKIDEALEMAERLKSHQDPRQDDDLDVPAFLRMRNRDLGLD